jgi:hypothetical protein
VKAVPDQLSQRIRTIVILTINLSQLLLGQEVSVFLVRVVEEGVLLPQLRAQVSVCGTEGVKDSLDKVTHGTCVTTRTGVAIINTSHVQQLLSSRRRNQSSTTRGRNQSDTDGTTLSSDLARDSVRHSTHTTPVSTTDRGDIKLGSSDSTTDGGGNLRGALDSKSQVTGGITDGNEGLETSTLTSRRLLLHRHDLHDLILKLVLQEEINDFGLLDGKRKEKDLLDGSNLLFLYQTSELGDGSPNVLLVAATTTSSSSASTASSATASATESSSAAITASAAIAAS